MKHTILVWKVTQDIYSSTAQVQIQGFYFGISIICNFILLLHNISEVNIVLFTPLYLSDSFSYKLFS